MSNLGNSAIVIEGSNAKKVHNFINQMVKYNTFNYKVKQLQLNGESGKSYITWYRSDDTNKLFIVLNTNKTDTTYAGYSYDIALKYEDNRLIIFCSYAHLNALSILIEDLIGNNQEDSKLYYAEWSEADCYTGCYIFDNEQKYFVINKVKNYYGEDDESITDVINYKDKDLERLVKDLANDQALYL